MRKKICLFLVISFFLNFSGITVLATDPPVRPEEMIGSADVRYVVDSLRETVRAGNTPGTGILILLNAMKEKISTQLSTAQESYPEVVGPISDTDQTKIESIIAEGIAKTNELIEKISAVIATPVEEIRVEQLDAIILMLDDAADMQGNILSTKPDLPNKLVSGTKEFKTRPVKATGADPTPEDLIETPEIQITPRIQEVADNLNNDPVEIFTWVRNNIDYEPYYGSLKGSNETLIDMAGNDCDQSSLLITLLRASNIPARYVRGDVELKIEDLMNWTGGKTPEAAVKIIQSNWIPTQVLYKFDAIEGVIFDHIWVEIFDGHNWRLADPSYKEYVYTEGTGITPEQETTLINLMEGAVTISENEKSFSANEDIIRNAMEAATAMTENCIPNGRKILVNEKNNLPPYLARGIIGDRKPAEEFSEIPDDMRVKVNLDIPDLWGMSDVDVTLPLVEISGKKLTITHEVNSYGTIVVRDGYRPLIQLDGETIVRASTALLIGGRYNVYVSLFRPGKDVWEPYEKKIVAGSQADICITTQKTSVNFLKEKITELEAVLNESGLSPANAMTNEMVSDSLQITNLTYFVLSDFVAELLSNQMHIVNTKHIDISFVTDDLIPITWFGYLIGVRKGGVTIDIQRSANNPVSALGNAEDSITWRQIEGGFGSNLEHAVLELLYNIGAVSTGKIFSEAAKAGIPVHVIKPETLEEDLANISASYTVKNHIRTYLTDETRVFEALIPQRGITLEDWSGQGWIIMEPSTGAAGYMISGGLHSDTILNGGGLINRLNNTIDKLINYLNNAENVTMAMIVIGGMMIASAARLVAMFYVFAVLGFTVGAVLLAGFLFYIAMLFTIVSIICLIRLMEDLMTACILPIRRRQFVYAV